MKIPRKLKSKLKKIRGGGNPFGFCYGISEADKRKYKNPKTQTCPYHSKDRLTCKLINIKVKTGDNESVQMDVLYACLSDSVSICATESKVVRQYFEEQEKAYFKKHGQYKS